MPVESEMTPCHAVGFNREIKSAVVISMEPVVHLMVFHLMGNRKQQQFKLWIKTV